MENSNQNPQVIVMKSTKSVGLAILLTVLFGPLGMLYSTVSGGIIMIVLSAIVAFFTVGIGLLVTWPICIIWAAVAAGNHNKGIGG